MGLEYLSDLDMNAGAQINWPDIFLKLKKVGLLNSEDASYTPLGGGVSSDIWLIEGAGEKYVVKKALAQLKVKAEWQADVRRNLAEQDFISYVDGFVPNGVAPVLYGDRREAFFVMPYYGSPWQTWKSLLLKEEVDLDVTAKAARLLAKIHLHSWQDSAVAQRFNNGEDFFQLRLEPYFVHTGAKHRDLKEIFDQEVARLQQCKIALMHGDFSPKNILVHQGRILLLDHEVACFGDPMFDVAFLINHLMLKRLVHSKLWQAPCLGLHAYHTYFNMMNDRDGGDLRCRFTKLWLMMMLARVDGKSPVEYLDERQSALIRSFVEKYLVRVEHLDFEILRERFMVEVAVVH